MQCVTEKGRPASTRARVRGGLLLCSNEEKGVKRSEKTLYMWRTDRDWDYQGKIEESYP